MVPVVVWRLCRYCIALNIHSGAQSNTFVRTNTFIYFTYKTTTQHNCIKNIINAIWFYITQGWSQKEYERNIVLKENLINPYWLINPRLKRLKVDDSHFSNDWKKLIKYVIDRGRIDWPNIGRSIDPASCLCLEN